jgi:ribonuclease G
VILTRKRVKQSLDKLLLQPCPYCSGSGQVKSVATVCSEIYDEVRKLVPDMPGQKLVLRVNPEVARALEADEAPVLKSLQALTGGGLTVHADALLHQEQFDVVAV